MNKNIYLNGLPLIFNFLIIYFNFRLLLKWYIDLNNYLLLNQKN